MLSGLLLLSLSLGAWRADSCATAKTWHVAKATIAGISAADQVNRIDEAVARVQAGDTIVIHGGVYREKVVLSQSGSAEAPITLRAAEGEYVVMTGADPITEWSQEPGEDHAYSAPWPHTFIGWNPHHTHPSDEYHRLIGRCEQVFINGYRLGQVLQRARLSRGTFYVDLDAQRLYVRAANDQDVTGRGVRVEASTRDRILDVEGSYVRIKGIRFRYAANRAQQGAVEFSGDHIAVEDCLFEYTNAGGAEFGGSDIVVRRCTFQHNGQLGFGANRAHRLLMTGCTVRNNNTRGFNRGWEAGGNKICLTRGAVIEKSTFVENRGNGIWFDIGNEDCEVRNCLIAFNEDAGIFYEISYGLHAHDNVIVGNGFAFTPGAWGAAAGISLSSSPGCTIERNLITGNKEGFNFREQRRSTRKIDGQSGPVWNHDQVIRNNVFAYNRDAQAWGWFDIDDERHWPRSMQQDPFVVTPSGVSSQDALTGTRETRLSLEDLNLTFENNLYCPAPGQGLFNWGVTWKKHMRYENLDDVRKELSLAQGGAVAKFHVEDYPALDFRVRADSPALKMGCYPQGTIPGIKLGTAN